MNFFKQVSNAYSNKENDKQRHEHKKSPLCRRHQPNWRFCNGKEEHHFPNLIIKKSPTIGELINGGGLEIRTLARLAPTIGFQDRPLQPLG